MFGAGRGPGISTGTLARSLTLARRMRPLTPQVREPALTVQSEKSMGVAASLAGQERWLQSTLASDEHPSPEKDIAGTEADSSGLTRHDSFAHVGAAV